MNFYISYAERPIDVPPDSVESIMPGVAEVSFPMNHNVLIFRSFKLAKKRLVRIIDDCMTKGIDEGRISLRDIIPTAVSVTALEDATEDWLESSAIGMRSLVVGMTFVFTISNVPINKPDDYEGNSTWTVEEDHSECTAEYCNINKIGLN